MMSAGKTTVNMRRFPGRECKLSTFSYPSDAAPVARLSSRDRILIWCCLIAIVALSWAYLLYLDHQMSSTMKQGTMMTQMGMPMEMPWTSADIFFAFTMWVVMMVGMMTGSAAPVMLLFAGAHVRRGGRRVPLIVLIFGLG